MWAAYEERLNELVARIAAAGHRERDHVAGIAMLIPTTSRKVFDGR
jgi:hypothetical protein